MVSAFRRGKTVLVSLAPMAEPCSSVRISINTLLAVLVALSVEAAFLASTIRDSIERTSPAGARLCFQATMTGLTGGLAAGIWMVAVSLPRWSTPWAPAATAVALTLIWGTVVLVLAFLCFGQGAGPRSGCLRGSAAACCARRRCRLLRVFSIVHAIVLVLSPVAFISAVRVGRVSDFCPPLMAHPEAVSGLPAGQSFPFGLSATDLAARRDVLGHLRVQCEFLVLSLVVFLNLCASSTLDAQAAISWRRKESAEASAAELGQAIAYVSHEARGPLNAAVLGLALMEDAPADTREEAELLSDLSISIDATRRHLDDLLLWERAGAAATDNASARGAHASWLGCCCSDGAPTPRSRAGASGAGQANTDGAWMHPTVALLGDIGQRFDGACAMAGQRLLLRCRVGQGGSSKQIGVFGATRSSPTASLEATAITEQGDSLDGTLHTSSVAEGLDPSQMSLPGIAAALQPSGEESHPEQVREGLEVFTDFGKLAGLCSNGVSNAIKHCSENRQSFAVVTVGLETRPDPNAERRHPTLAPAPPKARSLGRRGRPARGAGGARVTPASGSHSSGARTRTTSHSTPSRRTYGSPRPRASKPKLGVLTIEVRDNGAGIPQELLESGKLFQPFARLRQGDDSLRMASSGLGLAIVRSIVVGRLRGTVGLRSRENFGTVLFANVPVWCRRRTREFDRSAGTNAGSDDGDRTVLLSGVDSSTVPFWGFASGMSRMSSGNISALASSRDRATSQRLPSSQRHAQTTAAFRSVVGAASQPSRSFPADSVGMSTAATLDSGLQRQPSTSKELAPLEASPDDTAAPRPKAKWSRSTPQTGLPLGSSSSGQARPGPHEPTMLHGILKDSSRSRDDRRARRQQRRKIRAESGAGVLSKHHRLPAACHGTLAYVIDDERVNRTLLAALLRRWGLVVREFSDGAQAVAALLAALFARAASLRGVLSGRRPPDAPPSPGQAQPPSSTQWAGSRAAPAGAASTSASPAAEDGLPAFMTLDVEMPVLDGRGVLRAMKGMDWAASGTKPPPVVVVTGNARQHDNRELTSLGAQRVLTKPVDPKVLASFLSRALSRPGVAAPGAGGPAT